MATYDARIHPATIHAVPGNYTYGVKKRKKKKEGNYTYETTAAASSFEARARTRCRRADCLLDWPITHMPASGGRATQSRGRRARATNARGWTCAYHGPSPIGLRLTTPGGVRTPDAPRIAPRQDYVTTAAWSILVGHHDS